MIKIGVIIMLCSTLLLTSFSGAALAIVKLPTDTVPALKWSIEPEKPNYAPGEKVKFTMRLANPNPNSVTIHFSSGQQYDLEVSGPNGYFWRWSKDRAFIEVFMELTLQPGEQKEFPEFWSTTPTMELGTYSIVARLTAVEGQLVATTQLELAREEQITLPQFVFLQDPSGNVIVVITDDQAKLAQFRQMLTENQQMWVGGKLERKDNPPWRFTFDPATLTISEVTAEGLQATYLKTLEDELDYWIDLGYAYISARVIGINELPFPDIQGNWAFNAIMALYNQAIVVGYPDRTFRPDRSITRAEFAKIALLAAGLTPISPPSPTFTDLPTNHWAFSYVEAAAKAGLFTGFPDGTFRPEEKVLKEEVIAVLVRKMGWDIVTPPSPTFPDLSPEHWSAPYVETAIAEELLLPNESHLTDGIFQPGIPATRGQICVLVSRVLFQFERKNEQIVLRADSGGGLVPIEFFRQHVPAIHIFGDGTVIALRHGSVRWGSLSYAESLDLLTLLAAFGFLQMDELYQPSPMPTDLGTTTIELHTFSFDKQVSEYAWGAPAEFHYLYSFLLNFNLGETSEYIPKKSLLFVTALDLGTELNEDQKGRIVKLPEEFRASIPSLAELARMPDGYTLRGEQYAILAPLLAAHERILYVWENNQLYSLIVKITIVPVGT